MALTEFDPHIYLSLLIPHGGTEALTYLSETTTFYHYDLAIRNITNVTGFGSECQV
jgi:hypothetical protein